MSIAKLVTCFSLFTACGFALVNDCAGEIVLSEVLYDVQGSDNGFEWVEIFNDGDAPIDLSSYSIGYGGTHYAAATFQLSGTIQPSEYFVIGGPNSDASNANPVFDIATDFDPDIQNSGATADGIALFNVAAAEIDEFTIPIDVVIYGGTNTNGLIDETGAVGAVDVGDAPGGESIEFDGMGWTVNVAPNPGSGLLDVPMQPGYLCSYSETTYDVGFAPRAVAAADLNGDGHDDLVTANSNGDDISVLINNGDGTYANDVKYNSNEFPLAIAIGDLDGDLDLDLAVACSNNDSNVSIFLNNGDGTFGPQTSYLSGGFPDDVAMGDFDGDLDLDLAVANSSNNDVSIFLNSGSGTFTLQASYDVDDSARWVKVGDVDDDDNPDLVVGVPNIDIVCVLLNQGDGTFAAGANFAVGGDGPFSAILADLDGDLDLDLATANTISDDISILMNNGDGTFAASIEFPTDGDLPRHLTVNDFDGDLDLDLATANFLSEDVTLLLNDGTGVFSIETIYDVGSRPSGITSKDLNGDLAPDFATSNQSSSNVSVLLSNCTLLGDINLDGSVNLLDVGPFVELVSKGIFQAEGDINGDGVVNLLDVGPFIDLLGGS